MALASTHTLASLEAAARESGAGGPGGLLGALQGLATALMAAGGCGEAADGEPWLRDCTDMTLEVGKGRGEGVRRVCHGDLFNKSKHTGSYSLFSILQSVNEYGGGEVGHRMVQVVVCLPTFVSGARTLEQPRDLPLTRPTRRLLNSHHDAPDALPYRRTHSSAACTHSHARARGCRRGARWFSPTTAPGSTLCWTCRPPRRWLRAPCSWRWWRRASGRRPRAWTTWVHQCVQALCV